MLHDCLKGLGAVLALMSLLARLTETHYSSVAAATAASRRGNTLIATVSQQGVVLVHVSC